MTSPTTDAVRSPTAGSGRESAAGRRRGRTETGDGTWSIAQIADEFGVTHRTVRHYEDLGLISP